MLQLSIERYEFFPTNRALSLSSMDEDSTESKVDDLLHFVMQLVERQKEEVSVTLHESFLPTLSLNCVLEMTTQSTTSFTSVFLLPLLCYLTWQASF